MVRQCKCICLVSYVQYLLVVASRFAEAISRRRKDLQSNQFYRQGRILKEAVAADADAPADLPLCHCSPRAPQEHVKDLRR